MAAWYEMTPEQAAGWREFVAGLPELARAVAERHPVNELFRLKTTGMRCYPASYSEDGTLTVAVTGRHNRVLFGQKVFGVSPDNLEPCEVPAPGEDVGDTATEAGYTEDDIRNILLPRVLGKTPERN